MPFLVWGARRGGGVSGPDSQDPLPGGRGLTPAPSARRLCVLLLVCAAQAWLMWRFIHSQLRHWREYWTEQSAKRRSPAPPRLPARLIKRESGECRGLGRAAARLPRVAGLRGSTQTGPAAGSGPLPQPGSCLGLTGTWLGVGQGHAGGAGPD